MKVYTEYDHPPFVEQHPVIVASELPKRWQIYMEWDGRVVAAWDNPKVSRLPAWMDVA